MEEPVQSSPNSITAIKPNILDAVLTSASYGSVASFTSALLLQPLDRLKTLSQQETIRRSNTFQNVGTIVRNHGFQDLWRGTFPTILRVVPGVALYFGFLEFGQRIIHEKNQNPATHFMLGFCSRSLVAVTLMPTTVIKTRFESSLYRDESIFGAAKNILKTGGFQGLFKGVVPTVMRDAPFSGIYLAFYRRNTKLWERSFGEIAALDRFLCGVIAGICACAFTQPFDITKTQMQLYPNKFRSSLQAACLIYQTGGLMSFFNGFILRALRRTAMAAFSWTIFDGLWGKRLH